MPIPAPHRNLWLTSIAVFGVGDIVTTHRGLELPGVQELHPLSEVILDIGGTEGMVATKTALFLLAYAAYSQAPKEYRVGIPIGLTLLGVFITANNYNVIRQATA